jgi:hypothetical protein
MEEKRTDEEPIFIKVTNRDIYNELVDLKKAVQILNVKVYGIIGGFIAAIIYILQNGGL